MVVADGAFLEQRLSGGQRRSSSFARILDQREQTVDERTHEAGSGLLGNLPRRASQRQRFAPAALGQSDPSDFDRDPSMVRPLAAVRPPICPRPIAFAIADRFRWGKRMPRGY